MDQPYDICILTGGRQSLHGMPRGDHRHYRQPPVTRFCRFVDDTFIVWPHGHAGWAEVFLWAPQHTTSSSPLSTHEKENKLTFLDVQVTGSNTRSSLGAYCKPTHTDFYIPFHSHQHQRAITEVLRCMWDRAYWICDSTTNLSELKHLQDVFQANSFSLMIWWGDTLSSTVNCHSSTQPSNEEALKTLSCMPVTCQRS